MKLKLGLLLVLMAVMASPALAAGPVEFSADLTSVRNGRTVTGKLYVSRYAIRQELNLPDEVRVTIFRTDLKKVWSFSPQQPNYFEAELLERRTDLLAYGLTMKEIKEAKVVGTGVINGYFCLIIQYDYQDLKTTMIQWVSQELDFPIQTEIKGAKRINLVEALQNIREGPLPDSLFQVPPGYQKLDISIAPPEVEPAGT
jgi:hypothetical protein